MEQTYNYYFCKEKGNLRYDVRVFNNTIMDENEIFYKAKEIKKKTGWEVCYVYREPYWNSIYCGTY